MLLGFGFNFFERKSCDSISLKVGIVKSFETIFICVQTIKASYFELT